MNLSRGCGAGRGIGGNWKGPPPLVGLFAEGTVVVVEDLEARSHTHGERELAINNNGVPVRGLPSLQNRTLHLSWQSVPLVAGRIVLKIMLKGARGRSRASLRASSFHLPVSRSTDPTPSPAVGLR